MRAFLDAARALAARKAWLGWLLPAEWIALFALALAGALIVRGYPPLVPSLEGGEVLRQLSSTARYGTIVLVSIGLFVAVTIARGALRRELSLGALGRDTALLLRLLFALIVALYLMLCFKWWSHLGPRLYDSAYMRIDELLSPVKSALLSLDATLDLPHLYYFRIYGSAFITSYAISIALAPGLFTRLVTAGAAVCVLGGASYMLAPAYGPLYFALPPDALMGETQRIMLEVSEAFRASGGAVFDPDRFEAVLGAMPSLHVAHMAVITAYAFRLNKLLGAGYLVIALYVAAYAVVTHFHYLVDLPAGLAVAAVAVKLSDWLHARHEGARQKRPARAAALAARA